MSVTSSTSTGMFGPPSGGNSPSSNALLGEQRREHAEPRADQHEHDW